MRYMHEPSEAKRNLRPMFRMTGKTQDVGCFDAGIDGLWDLLLNEIFSQC